jgi:hypothetical protein
MSIDRRSSASAVRRTCRKLEPLTDETISRNIAGAPSPGGLIASSRASAVTIAVTSGRTCAVNMVATGDRVSAAILGVRRHRPLAASSGESRLGEAARSARFTCTGTRTAAADSGWLSSVSRSRSEAVGSTSRPLPALVTICARSVEHRDEWQPAERYQVASEAADDRCDTLIVDQVSEAKREYFKRDAKKFTRFFVPSTCPKSCCENSPGKPSKRTTGARAYGGATAQRGGRAGCQCSPSAGRAVDAARSRRRA